MVIIFSPTIFSMPMVLIINIFKNYVLERLNFFFFKLTSVYIFKLVLIINIAIENKGGSQVMRKPSFCITLQFSLLLLLSSFLTFFSNYTFFVKRILNN